MRKWELEDLVAEQDELMERVYDTILRGDTEAAREILAEALGFDEGKVTNGKTVGDGDKVSEV